MAIKINQNPSMGNHNTNKTRYAIKYIVIHYTGTANADAYNFIRASNNPSATRASADFYVGFDGTIWQYNTQLDKRSCWAVGGGRQSVYGGTFYGKATNMNCVSIEMCVRNATTNYNVNSPGWKLDAKTVNATAELTKYLMRKYDVTADRVIRHYDVNGKFCPGVIGWNAPSGSEAAWKAFKKKIMSSGASTVEEPAKQPASGSAGSSSGSSKGCPYIFKVTIPNLNIRKGPGTNYAKTGKFTGMGGFTIVEESAGQGASKWGRLKSGAGWIALDPAYGYAI